MLKMIPCQLVSIKLIFTSLSCMHAQIQGAGGLIPLWKITKVSLEIMLRTPLEKQLRLSGTVGRSSVKYIDDKEKKPLPP